MWQPSHFCHLLCTQAIMAGRDERADDLQSLFKAKRP
jgi:hypothetical protein